MKAALKLPLIALAAAFAMPVSATGNTLIGWAVLPAATFADGPTSGQFASPNPYGTNIPPYVDLQPVQGFSAVLHGPEKDTFLVMTDNGFGAQTNSADTLLRMYALKPDFKTAFGGTGTVSPVDFTLGTELGEFSIPAGSPSTISIASWKFPSRPIWITTTTIPSSQASTPASSSADF